MKKYIIIGTSVCDDTIYFDNKLYKNMAQIDTAIAWISASWEQNGYNANYSIGSSTLLITDNEDNLFVVYRIFEL